MPSAVRMNMRFQNNNVSKPNAFVRNAAANAVTSNLGRMSLSSSNMIGRLANSVPCGSCGK